MKKIEEKQEEELIIPVISFGNTQTVFCDMTEYNEDACKKRKKKTKKEEK